MSVLLDTNILARLIQRGHPHQVVAVGAVKRLEDRGDQIYVVPQNLYELWAVCTRPAGENGLGMNAESTQTEIDLRGMGDAGDRTRCERAECSRRTAGGCYESPRHQPATDLQCQPLHTFQQH